MSRLKLLRIPGPHLQTNYLANADLQESFDGNIIDHLLCLRVPDDVYG